MGAGGCSRVESVGKRKQLYEQAPELKSSSKFPAYKVKKKDWNSDLAWFPVLYVVY